MVKTRVITYGLGTLVLGLAALFACAPADAAPRAVVCDSMTDPSTLLSCTGGHYKASPLPSDIVRKGTSWANFVPAAFGTLLATDTLDVCNDETVTTDAAYAWPFNAATDPCHSWAVVPASTFTQAAGVAADLNVSWTLPTQNEDGTVAVLTGVELFVSTSPIADDPVGAPTATFAGDMVQAAYTGSVPVGSTLYVRVRARSAGGVGKLSDQASKLIELPPAPKPGMITNVTITLTIKK